MQLNLAGGVSKEITRFNTVNGKHCCNGLLEANSYAEFIESFNTVNGKHCCNVDLDLALLWKSFRFNTVNGKHCCNKLVLFGDKGAVYLVSIP